MNIAQLRIFNNEDLLHLLSQCSHLLHEAYQNTLEHDYMDASFESRMACEYLRCQLAISSPYYRIQ
jgi:hypothetical protein